MYDFAKEMYFDVKAMGYNSTRDRTLKKVLKSQGLSFSASSISNTLFLPTDPDVNCGRLKLLLQAKQGGNNSNITNDELVAKVIKLLEYKCIFRKRHELFLFECNLLRTKQINYLHTSDYNYSYKCMYTRKLLYVYMFFSSQMFKLNEECEINTSILKCDYFRYSPCEISTINTANSQIYVNVPREDRVISLLNSYLDLNFDVLHAATKKRYVDNNDLRLNNLGPIALISTF